ncbi:hypothetical protein, variant 1 [Aphanomyces invadans]|uniref:HECT-type E3 ubiquitin transferase n=2 Tax=Aphanomyces invadans TaxID=157072 RepID=A0A024TD83_9STRA|nr:hypothetical protein, variant 1 [Aphanomyces invadans]ETV92125.1 hypothetical protein, variant 1 [Aphanomyces invadans]|eukprot:XP_008879287.1 hypothetical protein, variant 1 [Aphanomyces invadans]
MQGQDSPSRDSMPADEAAALKEKFQQLYMELVATGLNPNDAVAEALTRLHSSTSGASFTQGPTLHAQPSQPPPLSAPSIPNTSNTPSKVVAPVVVTPVTSPTPSLSTALTLALLQANALPLPSMQSLVYDTFSHSEHLNISCFPGHSRQEIQEGLAMLVSHPVLANTMGNALQSWVNQPWTNSKKWTESSDLHQFWVILEHPLLFDPEYRQVVGGMAKLMYYLDDSTKEIVRARWASYPIDDLHRLLDVFHQYITLSLVGSELKMDKLFAVCSLMGLLHVINETSRKFCDFTAFYNDAVNSELNLLTDYAKSAIYLKHSSVAGPAHENRPLSDLSFCDFPFVLDPASKSLVLHFDSEYQQRITVQDSIASTPSLDGLMPYLVLRVRREFVVLDALQQLVQASSDQLKKPLKVKFLGEEGVDEGGVKKEFFQIIIRELLDPNFGMFLADNETHTLWFNCDSLESTMEFELIGILLGLAIYNGVILELHFPRLVYKKLMDQPVTLEDVELCQPALGKGLRQMLEFDGDVEAVYQRAFEVSYEVFGEVKTVDLVPNGKSINVTNANRKDYVAKYVHYVTTEAVERQYGAFHRGFHLVCGGSALALFRYEELELLVCGSPDLDFDALEAVTHYDDGYTEQSDVIKYFWTVVHGFSVEEKKQLLKFCTGSDRVPIRGLSEMTFVISRNGPDSNKLPTAHTCFNHLLLPEYASQDKLKERLMVAISQAEGFGLL